jgi:hypothetical protein
MVECNILLHATIWLGPPCANMDRPSLATINSFLRGLVQGSTNNCNSDRMSFQLSPFVTHTTHHYTLLLDTTRS